MQVNVQVISTHGLKQLCIHMKYTHEGATKTKKRTHRERIPHRSEEERKLNMDIS